MKRAALVASIALLLLAGCATGTHPANSAGAARTVKEPGDSLCLDDCLGNGGTREFCRSRCQY